MRRFLKRIFSIDVQLQLQFIVSMSQFTESSIPARPDASRFCQHNCMTLSTRYHYRWLSSVHCWIHLLWDQSYFLESISELTVFSIPPCKQNTIGCHACSVRCSSSNHDNRFLENITPTYPRRLVLLSSPQTQLPVFTFAKLHTSPFSVNAMVKSLPHATAKICAQDADGLGEVQTYRPAVQSTRLATSGDAGILQNSQVFQQFRAPRCTYQMEVAPRWRLGYLGLPHRPT